MDRIVGMPRRDASAITPDTQIIYDLSSSLITHHLLIKCKVIGHQAVYMLFQGTDGFH